MYTASPGITFRAAMSGWVHLGSVDPALGHAQGHAARTQLALEITVTIPDVRAFMHDQDQSGALQATIDFLPLGRELRSTHGTFKLLAQASSQHCRVATLECAFDAQGTPYYLAGRVEVLAEAGDGAGRETATVPLTLHEGTAAHSPIVGAGVLTLTPDGLARLASSVRVIGTESLGDSTLAITGFGRFFLGDLWEAYMHPPGTMRRRWNALTRGARRIGGRR